ncbi:MAG: hypothetical protein ACJAQT_002163 [Akkermansiaceae bacterium]|jgi:hypothetical protein
MSDEIRAKPPNDRLSPNTHQILNDPPFTMLIEYIAHTQIANEIDSFFYGAPLLRAQERVAKVNFTTLEYKFPDERLFLLFSSTFFSFAAFFGIFFRLVIRHDTGNGL